MNTNYPKVDQRTAKDIGRQIRHLLKFYVPEWKEQLNPDTQTPTGTGTALIEIYARYCELIINRLNQTPNKNFLAFLDLLGQSRLPPQPARAPLTFFLAQGRALDAIVPAGTQVAAPPAEEETEPVIFETEKELIVTSIQLSSFFTLDPTEDTYADLSLLTSPHDSGGSELFAGNEFLDHILYIGHQVLLGLQEIDTLTLNITLDKVAGDDCDLSWEYWNSGKWNPVIPDDKTSSLTQSGTVEFKNIVGMSLYPVNGINSFWLRCRLVTPITYSDNMVTGMIRNNKLPKIKQLGMTINVHLESQLLNSALTNLFPIDINK